MNEVATIQENLAGLFKRGEAQVEGFSVVVMTMIIAAAANDDDDDDQDDVAQVWTGDFNALTREDYTDAGWARVAEVPL